MNAENKPKRLGEILIDEGVITKDQLNIALTEQKKVHEPLGKLLVNLGFATEAIMRSALGEALEQASVDLSRVVPDPDAIKMINSDTARKHKIIPLNYDAIRSTLTIAMSDTFNLFTLDRIRIQIGQHIELIPVLAGEAEISNAIDQFYGYELSIDGILREIETGEADYTNYQGDIEEYSQPLVRLVDVMLSDAVKRGASDLHFEPEESFSNDLSNRSWFWIRLRCVLRAAGLLLIRNGMDNLLVTSRAAPIPRRLTIELAGIRPWCPALQGHRRPLPGAMGAIAFAGAARPCGR